MNASKLVLYSATRACFAHTRAHTSIAAAASGTRVRAPPSRWDAAEQKKNSRACRDARSVEYQNRFTMPFG